MMQVKLQTLYIFRDGWIPEYHYIVAAKCKDDAIGMVLGEAYKRHRIIEKVRFDKDGYCQILCFTERSPGIVLVIEEGS